MIKATITGPSTVPSLSSDLPIPPKQIADSAIDAAGAALAEIYFSTCPL